MIQCNLVQLVSGILFWKYFIFIGDIVGSSSTSLPIIVSPSRFDIGFFNETSKAQNSICPQKLANFLGIETFAQETNRFIFQFEGAKNY